MKKQLFLPLLLFVLTTICLNAQNIRLPIIQEGKYGYIDETGKVVIEPRFHNANNFSEGLAAVRENGFYGYIDESGTVKIQPQFDLAWDFSGDHAWVNKGGKMLLINREGQILFNHDYAEIDGFRGDEEVAVVKSQSGKYGVINLKGEIVVDTVYKKILPFQDERAVIVGMNHNTPLDTTNYDKRKYEIGVIDEAGNWVVEFGEYMSIQSFSDGMAMAQKDYEEAEKWESMGFIDKKGKWQFTVNLKEYYAEWEEARYMDGYLVVNCYLKPLEHLEYWSNRHQPTTKAVLDKKGKMHLKEMKFRSMTPFQEGVAIISHREQGTFIINKQGKALHNTPIERIRNMESQSQTPDLFQHGWEWAEVKDGHVAFNAEGKIIAGPINFDEDEEVYMDARLPVNGLLILSGYIEPEDEEEDEITVYGWWDPIGKNLVKAKYEYVEPASRIGQYIPVSQNGSLIWVRLDGKEIWKAPQKQPNNKLPQLNTEFMTRGHCYASSEPAGKYAGLGGWGSSSNKYRPFKKLEGRQSGQLQLLLKPEETDTFAGRFQGMHLYLLNNTNDTVVFPAQDSRLSLIMEAKTANGDWQAIEYLPSSWCGNSYHQVYLPANYGWQFTVPVYGGGVPAQLRMRLELEGKEIGGKNILRSNIVEGSINPAQFWNKPGYTPGGLMDPYND